MAKYNWNRSKPKSSHCPKGHEFTPENTFIRVYDNARVCRECRKEYAREKYQQNKIKNGGVARPKKDKQPMFELSESAQILDKALPLWYTLQEDLQDVQTPCKVKGPDLFTDRADEITADRAEWMCYGCPLLKQCYDFAVANDEKWGIWGGISFCEEEIELEFIE